MRIALLIVLVALVPLRGLAAVTTGLCAFAHEHGEAAHAHTHDHGASQGHDQPGPQGDTRCSSCAEHCAGSAFAPSTALPAPLAMTRAERASSQLHLTLGLYAERLDRPPLPR